MTRKLSALLQSRVFYTLAATALTYIFWWSGISKLLDFPSALAEMAHFGLQPAVLFAAATIAVQLLGSWLIISASRWAWVGAGALSAFTLTTIPLAHRFWEIDGIVAKLEQALVQEHISVIGGLMIAAAFSQWRHSQRDLPHLSSGQTTDANHPAAAPQRHPGSPASNRTSIPADPVRAAVIARHAQGNYPPPHRHLPLNLARYGHQP